MDGHENWSDPRPNQCKEKLIIINLKKTPLCIRYQMKHEILRLVMITCNISAGIIPFTDWKSNAHSDFIRLVLNRIKRAINKCSRDLALVPCVQILDRILERSSVC